MTWLKLSDDFAEDCVRAGLSDSAYRTHVDGLIWSMRRGTDGHLDHVSIRKGLDSEHAMDAIEELCAAGFWCHEGGVPDRAPHGAPAGGRSRRCTEGRDSRAGQEAPAQEGRAGLQ